MTAAEMAALHARGMSIPRAWSASEFADLLASPLVFAVGDNSAFALGRVVADEAELLTIVTDPERRRHGLGRSRLAAFEAEAATRGATQSYLEVAATNASARALYVAAGYTQSGLRKTYYATSDGAPVDAILMSKPLNPASNV